MYSRGHSFEKYNPMSLDRLTTLYKYHYDEGQDISISHSDFFKSLFNVNLDPVSNNPQNICYSSSPSG